MIDEKEILPSLFAHRAAMLKIATSSLQLQWKITNFAILISQVTSSHKTITQRYEMMVID